MSDSKTKAKSLTDLREALFATLDGVRNGTLDLDKARTINELGKTLIDSAKVEVDYLRVTNGDASEFLQVEAAPAPPPSTSWPAGITGVTRHRLEG